jgi:hypothetical protein
MNRTQANKIRAVSKAAKVANKAAAASRSRANSQDKAASRSRANSQDKAASRNLDKAVNSLSAEFR